MNYSLYKRKYPNDVLVIVEEFNRRDRSVLFDFLDKNEYQNFTKLLALDDTVDRPSMILLNNYTNRSIRTNSVYAIKPIIFESWRNQIERQNVNSNSLIIGFRINSALNDQVVFSESVTLDSNYRELNEMESSYQSEISETFFYSGNGINVTIRNVGSGNWNEVFYDEFVKVVFDAGAPLNATRDEVQSIIGDRNIKYAKDKPHLIISHWDKDHYHALLAMDTKQLNQNFSTLICRADPTGLTSRNLFMKIAAALGPAKTIALSPEPGSRVKRDNVRYIRKTNPTNSVVLYNSQHHSNRNISGITIGVQSKEKSIILSADCDYRQISRDILTDYSAISSHNLVVPHHGGDAGPFIYNLPKKVKPGLAIISVGANSYKHPDERNIIKLSSKGFQIRQTRHVGSDISLWL